MTKVTSDAESFTAFVPTFSKEQLIKSQRYAKRVDLINVLLSKETEYTTDEVDTLIDNFMKGVI